MPAGRPGNRRSARSSPREIGSRDGAAERLARPAPLACSCSLPGRTACIMGYDLRHRGRQRPRTPNRPGGCTLRCLECGADIAERAQVCARCGSWAPVEYQLYVTEDRAADAAYDAAGGLAPAAIDASVGQQRPESAPDPEVGAFVDEAEPRLAAQVSATRKAPAAKPKSRTADPAAGKSGDPIPPKHRLAGLRTRLGSRPDALVIAGASLVVLATILVSALANSPARSSAPSRSSPSRSSPSTFQASGDELLPGDCLKGSDLGLGTSDPWPDYVTVVPCTQKHIAEVFFANNAWPQSQAYPGANGVDSQAEDRCNTAFTAYDGTAPDNSVFTYDFMDPFASDDWASGDRWLVCVAYESTSRYPGGVPVDHSIKGSNQ
jgi:hypothetical protein